MKKPVNSMKTHFLSKVMIAIVLLQVHTHVLISQTSDSAKVADEKPAKDKRPVKDMFEGNYILNNQTAVIPTAKTLEFIIQHRFGLLNSEDFDLAGLYAPSNIRIGFNYAFNSRFQLGIGTTKNNKLQDLTYKFAIIKQSRSGNIPLSITYYGQTAIDVTGKNGEKFPATVDRLSYFNQIIFARKFSKKISAQIAPSWSHFNMVETGVIHDNIALSVNGRVKLTDALAILIEYDQNFTKQDANIITVKPNFGIGLEAATSNHVFQIIVCSGQAIVNQYNILYNKNDFFSWKGEFCIGFNMTRLWNY